MTANEFSKLLECAKAHVESLNEGYAVIVVEDEEGNIYYEAFDMHGSYDIAMIEKLSSSVAITKIVCMCKDGTLEVTPFKFRKALAEINENNNNAEILLQSKYDVHPHKIKDTF